MPVVDHLTPGIVATLPALAARLDLCRLLFRPHPGRRHRQGPHPGARRQLRRHPLCCGLGPAGRLAMWPVGWLPATVMAMMVAVVMPVVPVISVASDTEGYERESYIRRGIAIAIVRTSIAVA